MIPHDPPPPSRPVGPVAAAVLALPGLGIGHAVLGRGVRGAAQLSMTAALVAVAFATDAASAPWSWRIGFLSWMAVGAADAARIARRPAQVAGPQPPARRPAILAALVVLAIAGAYVGYGVAGRATFAAGIDDQRRGDCAAAGNAFDLVTGVFELTLDPVVPLASDARQACDAYLAAADDQAARRFREATDTLLALRRNHPDTALAPHVHRGLVDTYTAWAASLRSAGRPGDAVPVHRALITELGRDPRVARAREDLASTYLELAAHARSAMGAQPGAGRVPPARTAVDAAMRVATEFGSTQAARGAGQSLLDTYRAATRPLAERKFCDSLPVLDYFTGLVRGPADPVRAMAGADRPAAMLQCGLDRYRAAAFQDAVAVLVAFAEQYPDDPGLAQARSTVISARVTLALRGGDPSAPAPPLPAPLGGDSPGSVGVTFYNDTPAEILVRVAGPTAHEFVIPACEDCPVVSDGCSSTAGKPSHRLRLAPGSYAVFADSARNPRPRPLVEAAKVYEAGYVYTSCLFIDTR